MRQTISRRLRLFRTGPHPCSYKDEQLASTVFIDPSLPMNRHIYSRLTENGFRRSGAHFYRPDCENCGACIPLRIPVADFEWRRRYKRIWNANKDLTAVEDDLVDDDESFALYRKYIAARHGDGDMFPATREQYHAFIRTATPDTLFVKFMLDGELAAVCVADLLDQGISAVYTWFDPDLPGRSLGTYSIIWQIRRTLAAGLPYLFLGYWIRDCPKMDYKKDFRPVELLLDGNWARLN